MIGSGSSSPGPDRVGEGRTDRQPHDDADRNDGDGRRACLTLDLSSFRRASLSLSLPAQAEGVVICLTHVPQACTPLISTSPGRSTMVWNRATEHQTGDATHWTHCERARHKRPRRLPWSLQTNAPTRTGPPALMHVGVSDPVLNRQSGTREPPLRAWCMALVPALVHIAIQSNPVQSALIPRHTTKVQVPLTWYAPRVTASSQTALHKEMASFAV